MSSTGNFLAVIQSNICFKCVQTAALLLFLDTVQKIPVVIKVLLQVLLFAI